VIQQQAPSIVLVEEFVKKLEGVKRIEFEKNASEDLQRFQDCAKNVHDEYVMKRAAMPQIRLWHFLCINISSIMVSHSELCEENGDLFIAQKHLCSDKDEKVQHYD